MKGNSECTSCEGHGIIICENTGEKLADCLVGEGNRLPMWVIYHRPKDFPGEEFMARKHYSLPQPESTTQVIHASLDDLRDRFHSMGLVNIGRSHGDDPVIVEVWI